jgi:hypothetical protein
LFTSDDDDIAAYKPVAGQRPRNGQVQPMLYSRKINKHLFLSNGSVNTFPQKQYLIYCQATTHDNNSRIAGGGVFCWVCPKVI